MNRIFCTLCIATAVTGFFVVGTSQSVRAQDQRPQVPQPQRISLTIPPGDYTLIVITCRAEHELGGNICVGAGEMPILLSGGTTLTLPLGAPTAMRDNPRITYTSYNGGSLEGWGVSDGKMVPFPAKREQP